MNGRVRANGLERESVARYRCEADGIHHPDCPGEAGRSGHMVIHHVYRRGHTPEGVDRDAVENLRYVWNGATKLGAGGCHGQIHRHVDDAADLGLLHVDRDYCSTCGARTGNPHWKGCPG